MLAPHLCLEGRAVLNSFSKTDVANLALSHLMTGKSIDNIDTEQSPEAITMRTYLSIAIGTTLREFAWPFATQYQTLGLVQTFPSNQGYAYHYSYRRPADCVVVRRVSSGMRRDSIDSRIPFTESFDANGPLILCDMPLAMIEYTAFVDNPALYADDFVLALSYRLAMLSAPRLTGGDPFKVGQNCEREFYLAISKAQASALNEVEYGENLESEMIRARDDGGCSW